MSLNQAHWLNRQAAKATRKGHLTEAINRHREATEVLNEVLAAITAAKVAESVKLQIQFHEKEQKLLSQYQRQCNHIATQLEHLRYKMALASEAADRALPTPATETASVSSGGDYGFSQLRPLPPPGQSQGQLQNSIYRTFQETENLLGKLRHDEPVGHGPSVSPPSSASAPVTTFHTASKKPKGDKVIMEELEVANCHLRRMVDSLFVELDHCQRENHELKERIKELEEKVRLSNVREGQAQRRVEQEPEELPPLAPLEMPTFNFQR